MNQPARPLSRGSDRPPLALHDRAIDDLAYIRETMDRSRAFTAVSGGGAVAMGALAVAVTVPADPSDPIRWILIWLGTAVLAFTVGFLGTVWKARRTGEKVLGGPGRKFVLGMLPAFAVGGLLSVPFLQAGEVSFLPGVWLLLYGVAVTAGGTFSVRTVPAMGVSFMLLGALSILAPVLSLPTVSPDVWMGLGFGGLHLVFGLLIWRKHGG